MTLSVLIPVFKGSNTLGATLQSLRGQTDKHFTILIGNDTPPQEKEELIKTRNIVASFSDLTITYAENPQNHECQANFQKLVDTATSDLVLFIAHDDLCSPHAISRIRDVFSKHEDIGFITRPYYWFDSDPQKPIRAVFPPQQKDTRIEITCDKELFLKLVESLGQITGLALRKKWITRPYHPDIFPGHIYPVLDMWKKHPGMYLGDFLFAIGTETSQSKTLSTVYDDSPTLQWLRMYDSVFGEPSWQHVREWGREHILTNYVGLVQIKNYGTPHALFKEIAILGQFRKRNFVSFSFISILFIILLTPRMILRWITPHVKKLIIGSEIKNIRIKLQS